MDNIYLAGGMQGLTFSQQNTWREYMERTLYERARLKEQINIINPVKYFNFETKRHETEREVMEFDLHKVRNSNLVIVGFNAPKSLGTMAEMAIAYEHKIPIIGWNGAGEVLHPWQTEMCNRIFTDIDELIDYISEFYLG